jgi:hypothetical protein
MFEMVAANDNHSIFDLLGIKIGEVRNLSGYTRTQTVYLTNS